MYENESESSIQPEALTRDRACKSFAQVLLCWGSGQVLQRKRPFSFDSSSQVQQSWLIQWRIWKRNHFSRFEFNALLNQTFEFESGSSDRLWGLMEWDDMWRWIQTSCFEAAVVMYCEDKWNEMICDGGWMMGWVSKLTDCKRRSIFWNKWEPLTIENLAATWLWDSP